MRPSPQEQAHRLREMAAIIRATAPAGRYRQTTLVPATYMEWAAETIEGLLKPAPTKGENEARLWIAYLRSTAGVLRGKDLPLMADQHEDAANRFEALFERVADQCGACGTPTCSSCFHDCELCGKQFCPKCADRVCPHHELDVAGDVQEVLAAEGFEDLGVDERGPGHLAIHRRVRDFSQGANPPRYKYEPVDPPTRCTSTICYCNMCP